MSGSSIPNFHNPSQVLYSRFLPTVGPTKHVVVLLHAFPFSSAMWQRVAEQLQSLRSDTALLLIDFPGFGSSTSRPQWDFSSFSLELRGVIEHHTRKPVTIAGLSMGGYAALEFARVNSDLVRAIVLSNTRAQADTEKEKLNRATFAEDVLARGPDTTIERLYANFVTSDTNPNIANDIRSWMLEANPVAITTALKAMANRRDSSVILPNITVPSLVIAGDRDRVTRTTVMRKMANELINASFIEIKGAAHLSAVEKPNEWATALAHFLDCI
jgi:3-oxoadipate enol-lactonase